MRRFKELRQLRGLSPEKLAKKMGLSRATWFNKQNGTFEITVEEAELAARVLNVKFQVILDGKDVLSGVPASVSSHEETDHHERASRHPRWADGPARRRAANEGAPSSREHDERNGFRRTGRGARAKARPGQGELWPSNVIPFRKRS
jgi:transcriptional regulator with XRE-family HTH domain